MAASPKTRKKTAFVPKIVFSAVAAVSVVPLCAGAVACGGEALGKTDSGSDVQFTVACQSFDGGPCTNVGDVATIGFDASDVVQGVAVIGFDASDVVQGVAVIGFDGGDAPSDVQFGVADVGFHDAPLGVAVMAFDAGGKG